MKKTFKLLTAFAIALITTISTTACTKIPVQQSDGFTKVSLSRETEYGNDWIYFSFAEGKELTGIDESNRGDNLKWDIAFNRYNFRTNSGLSGKGQGGVLDTGETDLNLIPAVPEGEFEVDEMGEIIKSMSSMPPPKMKTPLNKLLGKAIKMKMQMPPVYVPNNHVYIIRTADGKYAKIKVLGFYNEEEESGYVTFEYEYQPDGSLTFNK